MNPRDNISAELERFARERWITLQFDDLDTDPRALLARLAESTTTPAPARKLLADALAVDMSKLSNRKGVGAALKLTPKTEQERFDDLVHEMVEHAVAQGGSIEASIETVVDVLAKLGAETKFNRRLNHEAIRKRHQRRRSRR